MAIGRPAVQAIFWLGVIAVAGGAFLVGNPFVFPHRVASAMLVVVAALGIAAMARRRLASVTLAI